MICPKCNAEMFNNGVCSKCNYSIGNMPDEKKVNIPIERFECSKQNMEYSLINSLNNGINKKSFVEYIVVFFIAFVCAILLIIPFNSYADKAMQCIQSGDEEGAYNYYSQYIEGKEEECEKFYSLLEDYMKDIYDSYNAGNIEYTNIYKMYTFIQNDLGYTGAKEYLSSISKLSTSKSAYSEGYKKYNAEEYTSAISWFSKVIIEDSNYEDAREQIKQAQNRNKLEYIDKLDEANGSSKNRIQVCYEALSSVYTACKNDIIDFDDPEIRQKYDSLCEYYISDLLSEEQYTNINEAKEVYAMFELAEECLLNEDDINTVNTKFSEVKKFIIRDVKEQYKTFVANEKYDAAYDIISENLKYDDNSGTLQSAINDLVHVMSKKIDSLN